MIEHMTFRNLSPATQRSYVHAVAKFAASLTARRSGLVWRKSAVPSTSGCWRHIVAGVEHRHACDVRRLGEFAGARADEHAGYGPPSSKPDQGDRERLGMPAGCAESKLGHADLAEPHQRGPDQRDHSKTALGLNVDWPRMLTQFEPTNALPCRARPLSISSSPAGAGATNAVCTGRMGRLWAAQG